MRITARETTIVVFFIGLAILLSSDFQRSTPPPILTAGQSLPTDTEDPNQPTSSSDQHVELDGNPRDERNFWPPEEQLRQSHLRTVHSQKMRLGGAQYFAWLASAEGELPGWVPVANPIVCRGEEYYSGHFSIPEENIVDTVPRKSQVWASVIPGRKETYVFTEEGSYRQDLERSMFALTRRRYGFATNRNLEILAAGSVPYFCLVGTIPRTGTLASLPIGFMQMVPHFPGVAAHCTPHKKAFGHHLGPLFDETMYYTVATRLLNYTKKYQPTTYFAKYVLSATDLKVGVVPASVLVLWASHYTIMLTSLIHGLVRLGVHVTDYPRRAEVWKGTGCEEARRKTYAKGWFFFCKAEESVDVNRTDIEERILLKEFDLIIISVTDYLTYRIVDARKEIPFYDAIFRSYPRRRVVVMNDADLVKPMTADVAHKHLHNISLYFKRETHGCTESIW